MTGGSTSVVTDGSGNNEQDLAYYPYGDTFLDVGSKDVKFKYTGQEKDDSTGLYFYNARYYDSFLGRFISADTIVPNPLDPQALNRYSYVLNNPIIYTDPSGHFVCGGVCITVIASAAYAGINTAIQGGSISDIFINATIAGTAAAVSFGVSGYVSPAVGPFVGGIIGSAAGAASSSALHRAAGRDVNIGKSVGFAALSAAAGGAVSGLNLPWEQDIIASGLVGGGVSELAGGSFAEGFRQAAVASALNHHQDITDAFTRSRGPTNLGEVAAAGDFKEVTKFAAKKVVGGVVKSPLGPIGLLLEGASLLT